MMGRNDGTGMKLLFMQKKIKERQKLTAFWILTISSISCCRPLLGYRGLVVVMPCHMGSVWGGERSSITLFTSIGTMELDSLRVGKCLLCFAFLDGSLMQQHDTPWCPTPVVTRWAIWTFQTHCRFIGVVKTNMDLSLQR